LRDTGLKRQVMAWWTMPMRSRRAVFVIEGRADITPNRGSSWKPRTVRGIFRAPGSLLERVHERPPAFSAFSGI
jgi:hypothetical protein